MRSFRVGGTSLPTFESSVNKSVQVVYRDPIACHHAPYPFYIRSLPAPLSHCFVRFPRLRAEERAEAIEDERPPLSPLCRKLVRCARAFDVSFPGRCSCREIADHGRGVKSRLSSNLLLSFHANFNRCSARSARSTCLLLLLFFFMRAPISFLASAFSNRI